MVTERQDNTPRSQLTRLLREPTVHFFALAAAALLVQRLLTGDAQTIELTPALKADIVRRFHDQMGRTPTSAEAAAAVEAWKTDEILYREALRLGLDREDPAVKNLLINNLRGRLLLQTPRHEPTDAELAQFLERHRADYEAPLVYEYELVGFPNAQRDSAEQRGKAEAQLAGGATAAALGLSSTAANVNRERMDRELGPEVAEQVRQLPKGQWRELQTSDRLLLVKLNRVEGGLAEPELLRAQLRAGYSAEAAQQVVQQATDALARRYRFEEKAR